MKSEEECLEQEKVNLQNKIQEQQEKLRQEESDKKKLIQKYNQLCNGIITKHDYEKDIKDAKKQLEELKNDDSHHQNYLKSQKILAEKKKEMNQMDAKSRQIQESINKINVSITEFREKIAFFKSNKNLVKAKMIENTKIMTEKLEKNRMALKRQLFFLQNLIPKNFVQMIENLSGSGESAKPLTPYSLSGLKRPLCLNFYSLQDSYKNAYINKVRLKKMKIEYPRDEEIYENDFQEESHQKECLNLKYFTTEDGRIFDVNANVLETFK